MAAACMADPAVVKSPYGTMKELDSGDFLFTFKRDRLDQSQPDKTAAIKAYIDSHGLPPARCTNGITIIRQGAAENGYGWALIRCSG